MKPKQKHKRGAERYSLDIYTPLTRDECLARLKAARKDSRRQYTYTLSMSNKGNKVVIKAHDGFMITQFHGHLEPYVAGTHVYGKVRRLRHSNYGVGRFEILLFITPLLLGLALCLAAALRNKPDAYILGFMFLLFAMFSGVILFFPTLDTGQGNRLLRWIDEQLNVEAADETQTEA